VLDMARSTAGGNVDADAPLMDSGVDSLGAVELRNQLRSVVGIAVDIPSTLVFDYPTARQLAGYFNIDAFHPEDVLGEESGRVHDASMQLACVQAKLPQGVEELQAVWQMLATGRDTFSTCPATRWMPDSQARYGAFQVGVEFFDSTAFFLSAQEVTTMDPQQRVLLEQGYATLCGGGLSRTTLSGSNTAIYVGVMSTEVRPQAPNRAPACAHHALPDC